MAQKALPEEVYEKIKKIQPDRGYWFIRTDSGINFDNFLEGNYIGIGWNSISENDIRNSTPEEVKTKIAKLYKYDLDLAK